MIFQTHETAYILRRQKKSVIAESGLYAIGDYLESGVGVSTITDREDFLIDPDYTETEGSKPCYVWKI